MFFAAKNALIWRLILENIAVLVNLSEIYCFLGALEKCNFSINLLIYDIFNEY